MKKANGKLIPFLVLLLVWGFFGSAVLAAAPAAGPEPKLAPMEEIVSDGGVLSAPIHSLHSSARGLNRAVSLPAQFRLSESQVTPVRDQGWWGTCWAHAAMGSAESIAKTEGLLADPDFSEWQAVYYTYVRQNGRPAFDLEGSTPLMRGGNNYQVMALMARGSSPLLENQAPYPDPYGLESAAMGNPPSPSVPPAYELKAAYLGHTPEEWKTLLMNKGALSVAFYVDDSYFYDGAGGCSYYLPVSYGDTNHLVTLVGWDDTYPAANFRDPPPGNGAWIIKNSWGDGWGDDGYFYMSYYTQDLYNEAFAFELMQPVADEAENTWSDLGWVANIGYGSDTGWMKSVFTAATPEALSTVGTFATGDNTAYSLQITTYDAGAGAYVPQGAPQTGTIAQPGYARIDLANPVLLAAGQKYEVILRLTVPGTAAPLPIEMPYPGWSSQATSAPGQSLFSADGGAWTDCSGGGYDACIYAFADTTPAAPSSCAVQFNTQGGGAVASQTVAYNGLVAKPANPARAGYTFAGWFKDSAGKTAWNFTADRVTWNTVLWAKWTPAAYPISYNLNGGTVSTANPTSYTVESKAFSLINPTKAGYTFAGWTGTGLSKAATTVAIPKGSTGPRSYTANWTAMTCAIAAAPNNTAYGTVSGAGAYAYSATVTLKATPKAGYRFVNWLEGGKTVSTSATYAFKATAKRTLTATFAAIPTPAVTAASAGYNSVKLSWPAVAGAAGYELSRATSSTGKYTVLTTTTAAAYTSTGLTTNTTYYYKVRVKCVATTATTYGGYSAVKSAKPVPATPGGVKAARVSGSSIKVSWGKVSGASGYEVARATAKTGKYTTVRTVTSGSAVSYTNTGLKKGTTYYFKVRAYRTVGGKRVYSAAYSAIVSAKP